MSMGPSHFDFLDRWQNDDPPLTEAEYRLEAIPADSIVAEALGTNAGGPIFLVERTSYTDGERPVDYEKLHYRGDHIQFVTRLARRTSTRHEGER
jgi:GntR family transcriptional regulator